MSMDLLVVYLMIAFIIGSAILITIADNKKEIAQKALLTIIIVLFVQWFGRLVLID